MTIRPAAQDRPCRHACRHYDCLIDRGEPLPEHVTAYVGGVLYVPSAPANAEPAPVVSEEP